LKIKILKDANNGFYLTRHVSENSGQELSEDKKKELYSLLHDFAKDIIENDNVSEEIFIKLVQISPHNNDGDLLNNMIRDIYVWKSYKEDFDEEVDFPLDQYYKELIKK